MTVKVYPASSLRASTTDETAVKSHYVPSLFVAPQHYKKAGKGVEGKCGNAWKNYIIFNGR